MTDHDQERQPLLSSGRSQCATPSPVARPSTLGAKLAHYWPILRALAIGVLFGTAFYASQPSLLDATRSFTCAFHYQRHPELLPSDPNAPLPLDSNRPCAVSGVEAKVGIVSAIQNFGLFGISSISLLFYGPRLSTWGRKPLLTLAAVSNLVGLLPYALLPMGYPFGPRPDEMSISPTASMIILLVSTCTQGLMGDAPLFLCVLNAITVDASQPETRSIFLSWTLTSILVGCFLGPALAAWALSRSRQHAKAMVLSLFQTTIQQWVQHPKHGQRQEVGVGQPPIFQEPGNGTIPVFPSPSPPAHDSPPALPRISTHGNTAALRMASVIYLIVLVWILLVLPETLKRGGDKKTAAQADATESLQDSEGVGNAAASLPPASHRAAPSSRLPLGALSIFSPVTLPSGHRDYRLTKLGTTVMLSSVGTTGLTYVMLYAGYKFDMGPETIGFFLALMGGSRAAWLMAGVPAITKALERVVARRHPAAAGGGRGGGGEGESEGDEVDSVPTRARIDLYLACISYCIEVAGYVIIVVGATVPSLPVMAIGTVSLSLGAAANPALNSAAISIASARPPTVDVAPEATAAAEESKPVGDAWLSASASADTLFKFIGPVLYSLVYSLTVETRWWSAASFLIPLVAYSVAVGLVLSVVV
ncbi:hypothetical protein ACQY0O_005719 [Thecaphora frezii]